MRTVRLAISAIAVATLIPLSAGGAFAAGPPANDTPSGALPISLGDSVTQDTTQATTDALDAKLNAVCGAPFTNASVWYTYTPAKAGSFVLDTKKSDYSVGLMIFQGKPTQGSLITCGPTTIGLDAQAGTTYTIMVFSATKVNGGNLAMSLKTGPPAPTFTVTVDPTGQAFKDGSAEISGTFTCKSASFLDLSGQLVQIWRRVKITGYYGTEFDSMCDGKVHDWTQTVVSDNGLYAKGSATVSMDNFACGLIDCTEITGTSEVTLSKAAPGAVPAGPARSSATLHSTSCVATRSGTPYQRSIACQAASRA